MFLFVHFALHSAFVSVLHAVCSVPMCALDGFMVPRRPLVVELSDDDKVLAWALIIESGHIPLRTLLGNCSRDLYMTLATETTCLGATSCLSGPSSHLGTSASK